MVAHGVLEFIERRFKTDCDWKTCYYFAITMSERFRKRESVLYYDTADGYDIIRDVIL